MSAGIVSATIRVTVVGSAGRADLAVPLWVDVDTLAHSYADLVGASAPPPLTTSGGVLLDGTRTVELAGLRHGDVVVALDEADGPQPGRRRREVRRGLSGAFDRQPLLLALAALCGLAGAGVLAATGGAGPARVVCLVLLLLCALTCVAPMAGASGAAARARSAAAPAFAAGAGFVAAYSSAPGGLLLGLAVAALAAAVLAAVGRTFLDSEHDELVEIWLAVAAALALLTVLLLLLGGSVQGLWAVLFAAAVVGARLLPYTVVDVPDQALLDLDRLAVTAWSAREQPRGSRRRRSIVRLDGVTEVVRRGLRLVAAGTVVIAVVAAVTGPLLALGAGRGLQGLSTLVMVGLGGAALALVARSFRSALPRVALRCAAVWVLAFLGYDVLDTYGRTADWVTFAAVLALALVVTLSAVSLGRGWRSVWWARVADLVEGLSIVLVVAAVPLASGFYEVVRGFTA
ncbi:EsaB/YukD family protein [Nocardioides panacis]|uniref:EsaB/YukD family protein n=1 Tax=Nocardioides panacis TaxID=2849501 RepID=A0A975SZA5_9ACTN|nr:EsaB/YukD family protein [Nocardioides panacis]QWZ07983.1 EsaB/YukD family protein [Nocardioides panacis]